MMRRLLECRSIAPVLAVLLALSLSGRSALAQATNGPALQVPRASTRDYTAALVGGSGATVIGQWRESAGKGMHWQLEGGISDPKGAGDPQLLVGGGVGRELLRASADQPLDLLLTAGVGAALGGNATTLRAPVGVSVGRTIEINDKMALIPFVHPRLSLDLCTRCGTNRGGRSAVSLNVDLGAAWQVTPAFGVTGAVGFSGSEITGSDDTLAVGVKWTPRGLN